jgi:hypothetical protein
MHKEEVDVSHTSATESAVAALQSEPALIHFKTTVKRKLGRSVRNLDVDLINRTVIQTTGGVKKVFSLIAAAPFPPLFPPRVRMQVVHCHKFVNILPTGQHESEVQATIVEGKGSKASKTKVWRFRDDADAKRFQNLVHMLNTSGMHLLEIFRGMDRGNKASHTSPPAPSVQRVSRLQGIPHGVRRGSCDGECRDADR